MKDRQIQSAGAQPSIFIISPVLHWLAMPAIVCLRSQFGFSFLSSKAVFFAFAWAHLLFSIYAWREQGAWVKYWAVASFGLGAVALYFLHLSLAFSREIGKEGKHDYYSGTSHLLRLPGFSQLRGNTGFENFLHLWIEPFLVFAFAAILRGFFAEQRLSKWLVVVAVGLWLKEFINFWYGIRSEKKIEDITDDAKERMPDGGSGDAPLPVAGTRKPRKERPPQGAESQTEVNALELRYAEVLRLMPPQAPFDLEQAERNYHDLIKIHHPDHTNSAPGSNEKTASLKEAIDYFRRTLGG